MSENLIDAISRSLTPEMVNEVAAFLHESPVSTGKAMSSIIPALWSGINRMASSPEGAAQLSTLILDSGNDGGISDDLSSMFGGGEATIGAIRQGEGLLSAILGKRMDSVTVTVSSLSGMRGSSAASLLALAAPLVVGTIGKVCAARGLDTHQLVDLLASQTGQVASAIPAEMVQPTSNFNVDGLRSPRSGPPAAAKAGGRRAWWPLLVVLIAGLGVLLHRTGRVAPPVASTASAMEPITLCDGASVVLGKGSLNYNLAQYLAQGRDAELPKTFMFDNLSFDSASAGLTASSRRNVEDLAVILKACPRAQIHLVSHTDDTGDAVKNRALANERALTIRRMLTASGVAAERVTAMGYGAEAPVPSNETSEDKARNRRTELVVVRR